MEKEDDRTIPPSLTAKELDRAIEQIDTGLNRPLVVIIKNNGGTAQTVRVFDCAELVNARNHPDVTIESYPDMFSYREMLQYITAHPTMFTKIFVTSREKKNTEFMCARYITRGILGSVSSIPMVTEKSEETEVDALADIKKGKSECTRDFLLDLHHHLQIDVRPRSSITLYAYPKQDLEKLLDEFTDRKKLQSL